VNLVELKKFAMFETIKLKIKNGLSKFSKAGVKTKAAN
jgi:hypothetical protein